MLDCRNRTRPVVDQKRDKQAQQSAEDHNQKTFGKQLPDETSSAGAHCEPHVNFFATPGGRREQQTSDVRAGNQHHHAHSKEGQKRAVVLGFKKDMTKSEAKIKLKEIICQGL